MQHLNGTSAKSLQMLEAHLNCPCTYFPPMADDTSVLNAYRSARKRGGLEGFWPLLVTVDAGRKMEALADRGMSRAEAISAPLEQGKEVLQRRLQTWRAEILDEDPDLNWNADILGEVSGGRPLNRFKGYWEWHNDGRYDNRTQPLVLAEIPVEYPWQIFAGLCFGSWNECPSDLEHMAIAKYWFETYGAVPAVLTYSTLEYDLPRPVPKEQAMRLALEQYGYCADIVDQSFSTIGTLADGLPRSTVWYFWWD